MDLDRVNGQNINCRVSNEHNPNSDDTQKIDNSYSMLVMDDEEIENGLDTLNSSDRKDDDTNLVEVHDLSSIYDSHSENPLKNNKNNNLNHLNSLTMLDENDDSIDLDSQKDQEINNEENLYEVHDLSSIFDSQSENPLKSEVVQVKNKNINNNSIPYIDNNKNNNSNKEMKWFSIAGVALFVVTIGFFMIKKKK
eukprot:TRINITY_DN17092_c0_g1_i1.p1 TRINITY_DN17092_c0_g1~~TRINITY_DN17092_c0_g1_i1.p1  ORF type:complete len:195 (-),score=52.97 TRINITY_DN17092_c0_g1_i1:22-606(-)